MLLFCWSWPCNLRKDRDRKFECDGEIASVIYNFRVSFKTFVIKIEG